MRRWRLRRADVGHFVDPPARPLAPVDAVVDDGLMIARSAVRLAAKNQVILSAVRDRRAFDLDGVREFARAELRRLADENEATAERVEEPSRDAALLPNVPTEVAEVAREAHRRRPGIHRALATRLREEADDDAAVGALVAEAQVAAVDELTRAVAARVTASRFEPDAAYARERPARLRELTDDLARLGDGTGARERRRSPDTRRNAASRSVT